jgi:hypothetical protein
MPATSSGDNGRSPGALRVRLASVVVRLASVSIGSVLLTDFR